MMKRKVLSILFACVMTVSMVSNVFATTQDEIAAAQAEKQAAQAELAQAQANISSLESKKWELENYLAELDAQYNELTNAISQLGVEAAEKEEELKVVQAELEKARAAAEQQYEAMKIRIAYMYEKGGSSMLELLLSSNSIADFLNQAENISKLSEYDREMLKKYEAIRESIRLQEAKVEEESASINQLLSEKAAKQQEVQSLAANTSANIASYVSQISASQEEASYLMAQVNSADNNISALMRQAAAEEAAAQAAAEAAAAESESSSSSEEVVEDGSFVILEDFDPETDTMESSSSSTSSTIIVEEEESDYAGSSEEDYYEESYEEEDYYEEEAEYAGSSGSGTYLGNFKLTAYCNCSTCCGSYSGGATASGVMPTPGHTVAMAGVPFGTQLLINGTVYTVEDLGTPYGHVDIYHGSHSEALSFGLQYADVYQLN